eukprot:TRINITY_DN263_c0_g1_i2.p4 TRINITY_DN263_c0_g1~~TRINITY_DN263_c0_g1_i2.p4  ORF type:complete len:116 (-),score=7.59 TRINITY_DN263_c0_g1_i2:283-630(-)
MAEVKPEGQTGETGGAPANLQIKIKSQDGDTIEFKVKSTTKLEKVFNFYCQRKGFEMGQVRFLFDGELVQATSTVGEVGLEDGDTMDCMAQQVGGSQWTVLQSELLQRSAVFAMH